MADYGFDGMIKVTFAPTVADLAAPKVSELQAGIDLECRLTPDGLTTTAETAEVDTSKLCSTSNSFVIGRDTYTVSVKYVRGDDEQAEAVQDALVRGARGFLVVRRDLLATVDWAAAQNVEVYPVQVRRPNPDSPAANALQGVMVPFSVTSQPKGFGDNAVVAAS
jgi:hypothetical protein